MKSKNIWKFTWIVLVISIVVGILIHFEKFVAIFNPSIIIKNNSQIPHSLIDSLIDVFISSLTVFFTFIINYFIVHPFDRTRKINWKKITGSIVITVISVIILSDLLFSLKNSLSSNDYPHGFMFLYFFRDLLIATIVIIAVYFIKIMNDRQMISMENEKLKNENLLSQYEALKRQVSPHFFFDSLTSLKELISQEPSKAEDYINHLSVVMRYTLQNNENKMQTLMEELNVIDSYFYLVKIRFENNLRIEININTDFEYYLLPSLALQTLVENAIKHNEISKRRPLVIKIETTSGQSLKVINNLQVKSTPEQSTGTGLINLSRQYQYLSGRDIPISKINDEFSVELPLLNPDNYESTNS